MVAGYLADLLQFRLIIWLLQRDNSVQILADISSCLALLSSVVFGPGKGGERSSNWSPGPSSLLGDVPPAPTTLRQHIRPETDGSKILFCHIKPPWK